VGALKVTGLRLEEVERAIADAYHQSYSTEYPAVFVRIQEYRMQRVSIVGAVATPGIYDLRHDQMSLVSLLMAAGGITAEGASKIRIVHDKGQPPDSYTVQAASQKSPMDPFAQDLRMTFLPHGAGHTRGRLSVYYRNDIVLSDTLDLSEDMQRMAFLRELDDKLPRLSLATVKDELVRLPQVMKSRQELASGTDQGRHTAAGASRVGFTGYDVHEAQVGPYLSPRSHAVGQAEAKQQPRSERTLVLPVRGLNIPFADVALEAGDRVTVEPLVMPMFTVIGLVNNQGNFEYPPGETFNLMEAIGFAQGLDRVADPRYAVIYRLTTEGNIVHTHYNISKAAHDDSELTAAMNTIIRPGDIVDIAQTPRTRTRVFLANIFRITIGAYVPIWDGHY
jgi:protein involved in polysaccharide export with SLBB domain